MANLEFPNDNVISTKKLEEAPDGILKKVNGYFTTRGINHTAIVHNKITPVSRSDANDILRNGKYVLQNMQWGVLFPYYDINRNITPYFGIRILTEEKRATFIQKPNKFVVPTGIPRLYFPLTNPNPDGLRCVITESAVKAIAATVCGYWAIGLNGCHGFASRKNGITLLPEFAEVPWSAFRDVVFAPDSDWQDNPQVNLSIVQLADRLRYMHNVELKHLKIPHHEDKKQGLDDYLMNNGLEKTIEFIGSTPANIELSDYMLAMSTLNENVAYVTSNNIFMNTADNHAMTENHFHTNFAKVQYSNQDDKMVRATRTWIGWEGRNQVKEIVNMPGQPLFPPDMDAYNIWRPNPVEPREGDVSLHLKFIETAIPDERERKWVMNWIAHLVQNPGIKMATAPVFYSAEEGTGKTMLAQAVSYMLGSKNSARTNQEVFRGQFNSSYATKQLVVINESSMDGRDIGTFMEKLKSFVTEETVMIRQMRTDPYEIRNFCHVILTSNHVQALKISPSDRRFAIIEFMSQFRKTAKAEEWGTECWMWHRDHIPELLNFYLSYKIEDFNPSHPAIQTSAKAEMIRAGLSEAESFVCLFMEDLEGALEEYKLRPDLRWLEVNLVMDLLMIPDIQRRSMATKIGAAFKKFGYTKAQYRTRNGLRRAYDLRKGEEIDKTQFEQDCLSPRGKKYDG